MSIGSNIAKNIDLLFKCLYVLAALVVILICIFIYQFSQVVDKPIDPEVKDQVEISEMKE